MCDSRERPAQFSAVDMQVAHGAGGRSRPVSSALLGAGAMFVSGRVGVSAHGPVLREGLIEVWDLFQVLRAGLGPGAEGSRILRREKMPQFSCESPDWALR